MQQSSACERPKFQSHFNYSFIPILQNKGRHLNLPCPDYTMLLTFLSLQCKLQFPSDAIKEKINKILTSASMYSFQNLPELGNWATRRS